MLSIIGSLIVTPQLALGQGDLQGAIVIGPYPLEEIHPEFIYRGAQTTHPLHYAEFYGVSPLDQPEVLDEARNAKSLKQVINHLTGRRAPFILTEGFLPTNLHFRTDAFDYGLMDLSRLNCEGCWTYEQLSAIDDPDYWRSIKQLYERGYRPVLNHHFKDLAEHSLVMQHLSAPPPGTGQPATYIDGNRVGRSSVGGGVVHRIDDSLYFMNVDPSVLDRVPTYENFMYEMTYPDFGDGSEGLTDSDSILVKENNPAKVRKSGSLISDGIFDPNPFEVTIGGPEFDPLAKPPKDSSTKIPTPENTASENTAPEDTAPKTSKPDPVPVEELETTVANRPDSPNAPNSSKGQGPGASSEPDFIVVTHDPEVPSKVRVTKLPVEQRLKLVSPEVRLRYQGVCSTLRHQRVRARIGGGLRGGGRLLRGAGAGLAFQYGVSEGLKATTGLDDDTANMVIMPLSEAVGMMAVDLALPTVATTTSTAAAGGTTAAATTGVGATVVSGAVGGLAVVTEATRRSADQHHLKLLYDENSMEMGTQMTIYLMRRNAHLRDIGEISQEELVQRNEALADSARKEGERTIREARWIGDRYRNIVTACFGTIGDAWDLWMGDNGY